MPIKDGIYYLSNSEASAWETDCPRVWKARHIDRLPELCADSVEVDVRDWGIFFESLAIGSGVNGKTVPEAKQIKMMKSDYYPRIKQQAADCRQYFKTMGGKVISRQKYVYTSVMDADGQEIFICGGWDVEYQNHDGSKMIIDLKMTGDSENSFGKYQFGNPDKINATQAVHYKLLHKCFYGEDAVFQYFVFDKSESMKQKRIGVEVSEVSEILHIEKLSRIYNEIQMALTLDDWGYVNTFDNCRNCPCPCEYRRVLPDLIDITV